MIKYPFTVKEKRVPLYLACSVLIVIPLTIFWFLSLQLEPLANGSPDDLYPVPSSAAKFLCLSVIVAYPAVSIVSILYAIKKLCKPGISNETRKLVLVRHVLSIVGFQISQAYFMMSFFVVQGIDVRTIYTATSVVIFSAQGIYMPLLRLSEPFFFGVVWQNIKDLRDKLLCRTNLKQQELQR
jgi:hypothetical protein